LFQSQSEQGAGSQLRLAEESQRRNGHVGQSGGRIKKPHRLRSRTSLREHQTVNGRCHQAKDVKARKNDMDWWPFHTTTLICRSSGNKLRQFIRSDSSISAAQLHMLGLASGWNAPVIGV